MGRQQHGCEYLYKHPFRDRNAHGRYRDTNVGATLNVGAAQPAGTYTNAAGFTVTVNSNN